MQKFKTLATSRLAMFIGGVVLALGLIWPSMGTAQNKSDPHAQHKDKQPPGEQDLASQIAELGEKVTRLEAALEKSGVGISPGTVRMSVKKPAMGGMEDDMPEMDSMQPDPGSPAAGGMGDGMMGMKMDQMMGMMEKMMSGGSMQPASGMADTGGTDGGMMGMKMDKMMGMMEKMMGGMGGGAAPATVESKLMEKMDKLIDMMGKTMSGGAMQPAPAMPAGGMQDM